MPLTKLFYSLFTLFTLFLYTLNCSSSSSSDGSSATDATASQNDGGTVELSTTISTNVDEEASMASPTATVSGSLSKVSGRVGLASPHEENPDAHFLEKKAVLEKILNATSEEDCYYRPHFKPNPPQGQCYGPSVSYNNHPDAGMTSPGNFPGGDLGIWDAETPEGEACAATKVNELVHDTSGFMGSAMGMAASLRCHAFFGGHLSTDLAEGEEVDLTDLFHQKMGDVGAELTVSRARIFHDSSRFNNLPVIHTDFTLTVDAADSHVTGTTIKVGVSHVPDKDSGLFHGRVWMEITKTGGFRQVGQLAGPVYEKMALSVLYQKVADTEVRFLSRRAYYNALSDAPFDSQKAIHWNSPWSGNALEVAMKVDPTTGFGSFRSAWQAGNMDKRSRVFLARLNSDGTGTAYFGFGQRLQTVADATNWPGKLEGMICNWLKYAQSGPMGPDTIVSRVQRQSMLLEESTGKWRANNSNIRFAPLDACSYGGGTFVYSTDAGLSMNNQSNDNFNGQAVSDNLVDLALIGAAFKPERLDSANFTF